MRTEPRDLEPYLARIRELPFVQDVWIAELARERGKLQLDAQIVLRTPTGDAVLAAELKRTTLTRELAERLVHLSSQVPHLIVLAPSVGRDLGDLFATHAIDFIDLAGNCHVHVEDKYLARVQGVRATHARGHGERALRAPALRVLFALLADPELSRATTRALATAAGGVSPQTASDARAKLISEGALLHTRSGIRWAPHGWKKALDVFLVGFPTLLPSLSIGRYRARAPNDVERILAEVLAQAGDWRWGGGAAAIRLDGHYRGDQTVVYLRDRDVVGNLQLPLIPDPRGPVVLNTAPGPLVFEGPKPDCAHPLLVYVDLLAEGHERATEAAGAIYDRYLAPIAEAA